MFLSEGYSSTSVSAIVRAAGVAQGTFYLYFKNKEQILVHLRTEVLRDYIASFEAGRQRRPAEKADARLVDGLGEIFKSVKRHRDLVRVFREATSGEQTERLWIEGRETFASPFAELIQEGVDDGSFQTDDPRITAHLGLAVFDDLLYEALEYGKPASGRQTLIHGTRFLLRALGSPAARVDELVPLKKGKR